MEPVTAPDRAWSEPLSASPREAVPALMEPVTAPDRAWSEPLSASVTDPVPAWIEPTTASLRVPSELVSGAVEPETRSVMACSEPVEAPARSPSDPLIVVPNCPREPSGAVMLVMEPVVAWIDPSLAPRMPAADPPSPVIDPMAASIGLMSPREP